ncbi:hypothetical protein LIER_11986 [Lithospermum erythrorhizon]|uniref:Uncharacterized protein n=1 Tax=Lithospermum erythrorhizon TaxID=34254 RepID=A0AAV3PRP8_LITER
MDNSHTRPHYHHQTTNNNNSNSSELFICFTSALSSNSSSMKISKSILSPGRCRDQPMSLSSSLSRRLKSNGSLKGGQASPIFTNSTNGAKKRGCGFENPEPSSPKVTCIGQVRVKTKKKAKQTRTLSRRRSGGDGSSRRLTDQGSGGGERFSLDNEKGILGNVSSHYTRANSSTHQQDCLPHRNQRWVHLPLTICEALRDFGAEFSCLFPCSSSCFSTSERGKEEKRNNNGDSCFARWLVTLQDEEGGKEREIELVVGGDEEESEDDVELRSSRRHVLEDFKISDEIFDGKGGRVEEEGRVSICIPPKNALLLMRCRSDPMKMASLTTKVWEAPPPQVEDEQEQEKGELFDGKRRIFGEEVVKEIEVVVDKCEAAEEVKEMVLEIQNLDSIEVEEVLDLPMQVQDEGKEEEEDLKQEAEVNMSEGDLLLEKEEELIFMEALEAHIRNIENEDISVQETELVNCVLLEQEANIKNSEIEEPNQIVEKEEEGCRMSCGSFTSAINQEDGEREEVETEKEAAEAETESISEKDSTFNTEPQLENQTEDFGNTHENEEVKDQEMKTSELKIEKETENEEEVFERRDQFMIEDNDEAVEKLSSLVSSSPKSSVLPDCLLLMMYEPKLSMEVSKETWVCSRDFSRWLPQRHKHVKQPLPATVAKNDDPIVANSDEVKKRNSTDSKSSLNKKSQSAHQAKQAAVAAAPPLEPQTALLPPRSSCSYPVAAVSMATMIEQKLVNAVGYEPFVLTRCKSEPMRTAGKLASAQDGCFWTKRKLEPLRRAAYHAGATRVGF